MIICKNRASRKNVLVSGIVSGFTLIIILILLGSLLNILYGKKRKYDKFEHNLENSILQRVQLPVLGSYAQYQDLQQTEDISDEEVAKRFDQNFDFFKCKNGFKIYVYPTDIQDVGLLSISYEKVLQSLRKNRYITNNPNEACLFVTSIDTLDRDKGSKKYVKDVDKKLERLIHWNKGENHLIFVFFSGGWPYYYENDLRFNFGKGILVKASASLQGCRKGFDVSLPLLPQQNDLLETPQYPNSIKEISKDTDMLLEQEVFPLFRKYFLGFKGKRYLYGIGSESRNVLRLINNFKDIVLLTTCRHENNWQKFKDKNCDYDNDQFDRYDYKELLYNSTFCLVPRGRRLGSFRFLEVLKYGCIPVLLSNGWDLPFSEVLDWSRFSINIDERLVMRTPFILRDISEETVLSMKQQAMFVWESYFSSMQNNIDTVLEVLKERIFPHKRHSYLAWNSYPGALSVSADFSSSPRNYPFYVKTLGTDISDKFTAVILAVTPVYKSSSPLFKLIKIINKSNSVDQILVVWLCDVNIPSKSKWPQTVVPLRVIHPPTKTMNERFVDMDLVRTESIFTFDEDVQLFTANQLDFAFSVWKSNPSRLVGFNTASHTYDITSATWKYSSKAQNQFSIISTTSAIFHRYYCHHYKTVAPREVLNLVERERTCESLAMNFLVSRITNHPPIKVTHESKYSDGDHAKPRLGKSFEGKEYSEIQQKCFNELIEIYLGLPLVHSKVSANPILYKDVVSISRKKFKYLG